MDAANALIDQRHWLWTVIYSRLGDATATEDILQEVSVAAVRTESDFSSTDDLRAWLYRVAIRQIVLLRRRESRHRSKVEKFAEQNPHWDTQNFVDWVCRNEQSEQIHRALADIKPGDRQILLLKYQNGQTCREIAADLGVSETTIQSRLLRARRRLRHLLIHKFNFESNETSFHGN